MCCIWWVDVWTDGRLRLCLCLCASRRVPAVPSTSRAIRTHSLWGMPAPSEGGWRAVPFAALHDPHTGAQFSGNGTRTSKYTLLTFLPKNLFEQLRKAANAYFLLISLLMFVGRQTGLFATSVEAITTLGPLILMMSASAVLAAADDVRRHQADQRTNRQKASTLR